MKKFLLIFTVVAVALALAAPAMADLKLTSKGRMDVAGIFLDNNIIDAAAGRDSSSNSWYQMELVIDPVLHINDKVKIWGRVTIMERNWTGNTLMDTSIGGLQDASVNYRGTHNFWWERLYLSFPLLGGTMYVGRMSGGSWAYPFQDNDDNRDRIKYARKFGHVVVVGLIEKLGEGDGGTFLTQAPAIGDSFDQSSSDLDAYAVGAVIPLSKNIVYRPLGYFIKFQQGPAGSGYDFIFMNGLMIKSGAFKLDTEINWRTRDWDNSVDTDQFSAWVDAQMGFGPATLAVGGFWIGGSDETVNPLDTGTIWGTGREFDPYFLFFSEDVGLLSNTTGVPNGSLGSSGYKSFYVRGEYKVSDAMKLKAVIGYLAADKMVTPGWDKGLGIEADLTLEWKFMPNLAYVMDFGYLAAGDYWGDRFPGLDNDVLGFRHMLVINW